MLLGMTDMTRKAMLALILTAAPVSAYAQDTSTGVATDTTTTNTTRTTRTDDNDFDWGWLGLLGLAGLAGLRRQEPKVVYRDHTTATTTTPPR